MPIVNLKTSVARLTYTLSFVGGLMYVIESETAGTEDLTELNNEQKKEYLEFKNFMDENAKRYGKKEWIKWDM